MHRKCQFFNKNIGHIFRKTIFFAKLKIFALLNLYLKIIILTNKNFAHKESCEPAKKKKHQTKLKIIKYYLHWVPKTHYENTLHIKINYPKERKFEKELYIKPISLNTIFEKLMLNIMLPITFFWNDIFYQNLRFFVKMNIFNKR